jgi:pimeloyl-ACP methyl ester carboxylesterase
MVTQRSAEGSVMRLRDGRSVCFAQYGDPEGFVVVNSHGGLSCRLDVASAGPAATAAGIRLISPDRPGVGRSDPRAGRTILDWADDVGELMDHLGVERFGVMGWSMGGQYAAAVGYALRSRVARVAIVAGALPLTEPGVFAQLPTIDRSYTRLSQLAPPIASLGFRVMGLAARYGPRLTGRIAAHELGAADAMVLRQEGLDTFSAMLGEGLRQPAGVVEEYRAWALPWGFAPEDLDVPVDVWAGTNDELVEPAWAPELGRRIPGATLHRRPGGHFVAHTCYPEIFEALRS